MKHYLLFYEKASDFEDTQAPLQAAHRTHVQAAARRGELLLGGSLANPVDGTAVLLFQSDSPAIAEGFAAADPYVIHGVVANWSVREWETVVGKGAAKPWQDETS